MVLKCHEQVTERHDEVKYDGRNVSGAEERQYAEESFSLNRTVILFQRKLRDQTPPNHKNMGHVQRRPPANYTDLCSSTLHL